MTVGGDEAAAVEHDDSIDDLVEESRVAVGHDHRCILRERSDSRCQLAHEPLSDPLRRPVEEDDTTAAPRDHREGQEPPLST